MTPHEFPATGKPELSTVEAWALIVDDHPLFCDALELTLRSVTNFTDVQTANCLEAAIGMIAERGAPDLVLLDLNLPDVSGLNGLTRLRREAEKSRVVVVSSVTDNTVINGAISLGASGFVPKHSRRSVFKEAFDEIDAGRVFTPGGFVPGEATEENDTLSRLASLTNQQARILNLICEGKLNKQIAYDLSIAETTVKAHVTAIMRKLGVQSRTQAVLVAHEAKLSESLPNEE